MKKTDTCYYMSITKEENSAFVVANHQTGSGTTDPSQVVVDSKTDRTTATAGTGSTTTTGATATATTGIAAATGAGTEGTTGGTLSTGSTPGVGTTMTSIFTPTTTLSASVAASGGNGTIGIGVTQHLRYSNGFKVPCDATRAVVTNESGESVSPGKPRTHVPPPGAPPPPQVILQVPSTPTPRHHNLLASDFHRDRRPSILPVPDMLTGSTLHLPGQESLDHEADESEDEMDDDVPWRSPSEKIAIVKGFPPVSPFIGVSPTLCYLLKEKKPLCCLQLAQVCEHCSYRNAREYNWQNKTIILAADYASNGIYNFIIPLRAHFRSKTSLNPIILLLERRPEIAFLDAISYFPLVYWMLGSIDCLDDLLRAGITLAENVVVVNKELSNSAEEDTLADCNTIVAVQTMFKFFPSIKSITELSQSSNMRFMQFRAHDKYALHLSKMEKVLLSATSGDNYPAEPPMGSPREKERGSHISYMFRLPFAAGSVFSASMLDTLLYQAFVKDYVITFVRLLLGVDQAPGSGFLTSMQITKEDMWIRTYGRLYQKLCSTTYEIPIGIYRTQDTSLADTSNGDSDAESDTGFMKTYRMKRSAAASCLSNCASRDKGTSAVSNASIYSVSLADEARDNHSQQIERAEIANLVRSRMESLNLPTVDYDDVSEKRNSLSYVIINPSCDLKLEEGDIVYLVRPSPFSAQKTFERHNSRRKSNISFCSAQLVAQMSAAAGGGAGGGGGGGSSRRGSGIGMARAPPLGSSSKSNSLSLPDSPTVAGGLRGRSNSLRVVDDILLRRSNSLRQGFTTRRKSSLEDIGFGGLSHPTNHNPIKIALNGSIGLEVTPPEEGSVGASPGASNTGILEVGLPSIPVMSPGYGCGLGGMSGVSGGALGAGLGGSLGGLYDPPILGLAPKSSGPREQASQDPQHLQGTILISLKMSIFHKIKGNFLIIDLFKDISSSRCYTHQELSFEYPHAFLIYFSYIHIYNIYKYMKTSHDNAITVFFSHCNSHFLPESGDADDDLALLHDIPSLPRLP
ncbi:GSCOCG00008969001-RA-CDS [Cotesia congregata]|nr:GSCOCG00008969001-RA-CDS [Cotesia congregata]